MGRGGAEGLYERLGFRTVGSGGPFIAAGTHLKERGRSWRSRSQAKQLAERLGKLGVEAIYTSPYRRAIETMDPERA
ncbi:MAG: hypothetical protein HN796_16430 [Gemmatimonadetes bacterium]|nr:hypothetical protein [Gemmatimonadota bacterium]MBT7455481.1 hypothetical protein [Gemmatimonadota bacterium]